MCAIGEVVLQGAVRFVVVWLFGDFCINSEEYDTRLQTVMYILLLTNSDVYTTINSAKFQ